MKDAPEEKQTNNFKSDIEALVLARLETFPEGKIISIGSEGEFNKYELINHVKKDDEIGKKIIEVELNYLKSLKNITSSVLNDE